MDRKIVLVVCGGNIHRSPIAEFCLNRTIKERILDREILVISRGIQGTSRGRNLKDYSLEWSVSGPLLMQHGIDIVNHVATPVDLSIIEQASLILAIDRKVLIDAPNSLIKQFPYHGYKMRLFREIEGKPEDVPDCFGSSDLSLHVQVIDVLVRVSKNIDTLSAYLNLFAG